MLLSLLYLPLFQLNEGIGILMSSLKTLELTALGTSSPAGPAFKKACLGGLVILTTGGSFYCLAGLAISSTGSSYSCLGGS